MKDDSFALLDPSVIFVILTEFGSGKAAKVGGE